MKQRALIESGGNSIRKAILLDQAIKASSSGDIAAFLIGFGSWSSTSADKRCAPFYVYLRVSGTTIQLVAKFPTSTYPQPEEHVVSLVNNVGASYVDDFTILKVHYVAENMVIIAYQYPTSATAKSAIYVRPITGYFSGTNPKILLGTATAISAVTSASVDVEAYLLRGLFSNYFNVRKAITISTGAYSLLSYPVQENYSTPALSLGNAMVNLSSNANVELEDLSKCPCAKGGIFYKNTSGDEYVNFVFNYGTTKNISVYNFSAQSFYSNNGNTFILGFTNGGYIVIATFKITNSKINLFIGCVNYNTGEFRGASQLNTGISINTNILAFSNNTITYSNGRRQKIIERGNNVRPTNDHYFELKELDTITFTSRTTLEMNSFQRLSPDSDIFSGVFLYE